MFFVKLVRRACARDSKFGQDASRSVERAQSKRNAGLLVVKPVRRACARGSKFGQDASLTQRPVGRAQCERNTGLLA